MIVYSPEGIAEEKEPVDARECVKHCGYSFEPPKGGEVVAKVETVVAGGATPITETVAVGQATPVVETPIVHGFSDMDDDQLKAYLTEKGVKFHHLLKHAGLLKLAEEA